MTRATRSTKQKKDHRNRNRITRSRDNIFCLRIESESSPDRIAKIPIRSDPFGTLRVRTLLSIFIWLSIKLLLRLSIWVFISCETIASEMVCSSSLKVLMYNRMRVFVLWKVSTLWGWITGKSETFKLHFLPISIIHCLKSFHLIKIRDHSWCVTSTRSDLSQNCSILFVLKCPKIPFRCLIL